MLLAFLGSLLGRFSGTVDDKCF